MGWDDCVDGLGAGVWALSLQCISPNRCRPLDRIGIENEQYLTVCAVWLFSRSHYLSAVCSRAVPSKCSKISRRLAPFRREAGGRDVK